MSGRRAERDAHLRPCCWIRQRGPVTGTLDEFAQSGRTTAVLETNCGVIVGGGGRDLAEVQVAALRQNESVARLKGAHAEITVLEHAKAIGATPIAMGTSRRILPRMRRRNPGLRGCAHILQVGMVARIDLGRVEHLRGGSSCRATRATRTAGSSRVRCCLRRACFPVVLAIQRRPRDGRPSVPSGGSRSGLGIRPWT
jgi:hypothetical protein